MIKQAASLTLAVLSVGALSTPPAAATAPRLDDDASVDLLDDALDAIADQDDAAYEALLVQATNGEIWLPEIVIDHLFDREVEELVIWSHVLDADPEYLREWAIEVIWIEREGLNDATVGGDTSLETAEDIADADENGVALLQVMDRRGVTVPPPVRTVLERLDQAGGQIPHDEIYADALAALGDTDADTPYDVTGDAPTVEPTADITAEPMNDAAPPTAPIGAEPTPDLATSSGALATAENAAATGGGAADSTTDTATAVAAAPPARADDGGGSQLLIIAALALAVVAILVGFSTALRGRKHDQLADIAFSDGLTGLKNRRRMDADVAALQGSAVATAALMVDVDHFKQFNDTHGHAVGDEVLRLVGSALNRQFRRTDVPYRYGGEEFCVLLPDTTADEAEAAGERVRRAISEIQLPVDQQVTVSIGVAIGPGEQLGDTIERADQALYAAKERGRNRVAVN